jgi:folate-binding protein YgfZ
MSDAEDLSALGTGAVRVDLTEGQSMGRALIVATGADRVRFLHGLVTGKVAGTPAGAGVRSALLTTKGQVVGDLRLFVRADEIWIVVPGGQAEALAAALSRYAIMDDFVATARSDFKLVAVLGPAAPARLASAGVDVGALAAQPGFSHAAIGDLWVVRARELGADGFWLAGTTADVDAIDARLAAAGMPRLSPALANVARIAALEPLWGAEITGDYFPMEVGLGGAVDYGKGCYLGQEPIVRIRDRGHINWRLVGLDLAAATAVDPAPGDLLEADTKPKAGRVTSAARLPDGRGVALALLHVSVAVGSQIRIKHGENTLPATVRADAGP